MVPLVLVPAINHDLMGAIAVVLVFSTITIATMCTMVLLGRWGLKFVSFAPVQQYGRAFAGLAISVSGLLILLGL